MKPSSMSAALAVVLGVCLAAAVIIASYYSLRAQVIPRLPLPALVLVFPLSSLVATLFLKWRRPTTTNAALVAYFVLVLLAVVFATLTVLPPEF